jgi:hypothetical protein
VTEELKAPEGVDCVELSSKLKNNGKEVLEQRTFHSHLVPNHESCMTHVAFKATTVVRTICWVKQDLK